ncbi:MAG: TRAP transporter small permease [Succinivibrio sp.]|nr:TRAP transporter small permease [Succinivibrio sp.]
MLHFINTRLEELIGAVMLLVMASIAFINVLVRYCTNFSFSSSEELTVNLFVWIVLLGVSRAFRDGTNFSMSLLYTACSRKVRLLMDLVSFVCSEVFFMALCYYGYIEVCDEVDLNVVSESLAIPVWLYTISVPLVSFIIMIRIFQRFKEKLKLTLKEEDGI